MAVSACATDAAGDIIDAPPTTVALSTSTTTSDVSSSTVSPTAVTSTSPSTTVTPATVVTTPEDTPITAGVPQLIVLDVDGVVREYRLFVPDVDGEPRALVVDLHGLGATPESQDGTSGFTSLASDEGFIVAQPSARGGIPTWNGQPGEPGKDLDLAFLRAVVDDVSKRVPTDPSRVFAAGFSNGGGMAHRVACEAPDVFVAVGTVAGQYPVVDDCSPGQPVPVMSFHGTADLIVPYRGVDGLLPDVPDWVDSWAARNGCDGAASLQRIGDDVVEEVWPACDDGGAVVFYTIEGGGHAWPGVATSGFFPATQTVDATSLMWQFFEANNRE